MARRFFVDRLGKPRRVILHGVSYGGLVGAKLLEEFATAPDGTKNYDGALLTSGLVTGSVRGYEFRVDLRVVYQHYCKNLPRPDEPRYPLWIGIPEDSKLDMRGLAALVDECTGVSKAAAERGEAQKRNLANITRVIGIPEGLLVRHMQSAAFVFRDIHKMLGGRNPFSNEGIRYKGSDDDEALNSSVERFSYDRSALADLRADGEPRGVLPIPAITIHSINDPQVMVEVQSSWRDAVRAAGNAERLVQTFTDEGEHSSQSAPELAAALGALAAWIDKGEKPSPKSIASGCETSRASLDGPCRFHVDYEPKPFWTRFYPRQETR
jgi:pimeloyl-ACP methyl ester carboxylesterase